MSETIQPDRNQTPSLPGIHLGLIKYLPEELANGLDERQELLWQFAIDPENPNIWSHVEDKVLEEEAQNTGQPEGLRDISANDLIQFERTVQATPAEDRYGLTVALAPNGKSWFDTLYGFHNPAGNEAIAHAVDRHLREAKEDKAAVVVDLGTGTGETAAAAEPHAGHVIGIDRNQALLEAAREKYPDIEFIEGDVTKLPFADGSVDIITSNGLKYALDSEQSSKMYGEISRVLKEGGVYIDADWTPTRDIVISIGGAGTVERPDFHPQELAQFVTWRAVLQDMIVDTVSGKFEKHDAMELKGHAWDDFKLRLGLYQSWLGGGRAEFSSQLAKARMLKKDPATAVAAERQHRAHIRSIVDR